jgi:hypothetical protein
MSPIRSHVADQGLERFDAAPPVGNPWPTSATSSILAGAPRGQDHPNGRHEVLTRGPEPTLDLGERGHTSSRA